MSKNSKNEKSFSHRCIDEAKRDKATESKRMKIINNVNDLTTDILEEPKIWVRYEFQNLRNFVDAVSNNPSKFPKNTSALAIFHENGNSI